jgi:hypothetical protein
VLDGCVPSLGKDHPDTLTSRHNLAVVLRDLARIEEAREEFHAVVSARGRELGVDHPDTQASRLRLADVLDGRQGVRKAGA